MHASYKSFFDSLTTKHPKQFKLKTYHGKGKTKFNCIDYKDSKGRKQSVILSRKN
jgi:hypothetical protein